jgi:predicted PurR-regulated permease PerM
MAALLSVVVIAVVILAPLTFFGYQVFTESREFYTGISEQGIDGLSFVDKTGSYLERYFGSILPDDFSLRVAQFKADLGDYLKNIAVWFLQNIGAVFSGLIQFLIGCFIAILALYYFLKNGNELRERLLAFSPLSDKYDSAILETLETAVNSVIKGVVVIAIIQAILTGVGLAIFGVPHAALWGSLAVVGALIPGIGTAIVIGPAVIFLFATGATGAAIGLALWGTIGVGLVDNFLSPYLISRGIRIHPLIILLSVIGSIGAFGPIGFILGPLIVSFLFALTHIYQEYIKART